MPRPATGKTFIARVRIPIGSWEKLAEGAGEGERAAWIREFVEAFNADAGLWLKARRIASARQETLWRVVADALRRYVARNEHLLDDGADPVTPPHRR